MAGWKKILTEGDDGSSLTYSTTIAGGVAAVADQDNFDGLTASDLKNKTFTELLDIFLFPTIDPTITTPKSTTITTSVGSFPTNPIEVGTSVGFTMTGTFNQGVITNGDGSVGPALVGAQSSVAYSGPGANSGTGVVSTIIGAGNNTWTRTVTHLVGTGAYYDNKGGVSTVFDPIPVGNGARAAGTTAATKTVVGRYLLFYDGIGTPLPEDSDTVKDANILVLNSSTSPEFTITITPGVTGVWFAAKGASVGITSAVFVESLGADVSDTFTSEVIQVSDASGTLHDYTVFKATIAGYPSTANYEIKLNNVSI